MGKHLSAYDQYMQSLGKSMSTSVSHYTKAYGEFKKIDKDVFRITDKEVSMGIEALTLEKPDEDDEG